MAGDTARTKQLIDAELRKLNETLSFSAASSGLLHNADVYTKDRLPMSARLGKYSQLKTVGRKETVKAANMPLVNQLGTTLAGDGLPRDATGRVAPDAELQVLAASGVIESAESLKAIAKTMVSRDTVNVYLHMKDGAEFKSDYRDNYNVTGEMQEQIRNKDRSNVGLFKLDEHRRYIEIAQRYKAWPPQSGVPPWPARKV